ncbi:hypothetical protein VTN77DRAFT_8867 [Rasamsonia byssochlamydoides]|uniref:uncharacterized protein n=1 Tax=Rasamsonia byssochlamydoides TaxID=89139 RepID=UPI003742E57B
MLSSPRIRHPRGVQPLVRRRLAQNFAVVQTGFSSHCNCTGCRSTEYNNNCSVRSTPYEALRPEERFGAGISCTRDSPTPDPHAAPRCCSGPTVT